MILEQWQHTENIRHTPASYMLERSLSDAWYDVVNEHIPVRRALNTAAVNTQQELTIKLQEFDYVGKTGEVIREYSMKPIEEIIELLKKNQ